MFIYILKKEKYNQDKIKILDFLFRKYYIRRFFIKSLYFFTEDNSNLSQNIRIIVFNFIATYVMSILNILKYSLIYITIAHLLPR